jgi:hypothetical protein
MKLTKKFLNFLIFACALVEFFFSNFVNLYLIKGAKTYLGPMLPPGGINWQLIYPHICGFT